MTNFSCVPLAPLIRYVREVRYITCWWFQIFFIFIPTWGNDPIWLIFFRWVETTNQITKKIWPEIGEVHVRKGSWGNIYFVPQYSLKIFINLFPWVHERDFLWLVNRDLYICVGDSGFFLGWLHPTIPHGMERDVQKNYHRIFKSLSEHMGFWGFFLTFNGREGLCRMHGMPRGHE